MSARPIASRNLRSAAMLTAATVLAGVLAGCAGMSEETSDRLFASPGRFDLHTCRDLAAQERATRERLHELEGLMARAEAGAGGTLVSAVAYRSDYLRTRAELKLVTDTAARRKCNAENPREDGRARG